MFRTTATKSMARICNWPGLLLWMVAVPAAAELPNSTAVVQEETITPAATRTVEFFHGLKQVDSGSLPTHRLQATPTNDAVSPTPAAMAPVPATTPVDAALTLQMQRAALAELVRACLAPTPTSVPVQPPTPLMPVVAEGPTRWQSTTQWLRENWHELRSAWQTATHDSAKALKEPKQRRWRDEPELLPAAVVESATASPPTAPVAPALPAPIQVVQQESWVSVFLAPFLGAFTAMFFALLAIGLPLHYYLRRQQPDLSQLQSLVQQEMARADAWRNAVVPMDPRPMMAAISPAVANAGNAAPNRSIDPLQPMATDASLPSRLPTTLPELDLPELRPDQQLELGLTFEEEQAAQQAVAQQREQALLQHIYEQNLQMQADIKLLVDESETVPPLLKLLVEDSAPQPEVDIQIEELATSTTALIESNTDSGIVIEAPTIATISQEPVETENQADHDMPVATVPSAKVASFPRLAKIDPYAMLAAELANDSLDDEEEEFFRRII